MSLPSIGVSLEFSVQFEDHADVDGRNPFSCRFGYIGSPLAIVITFWIIFLLLAIYTWLAAPR